MAMMSLMETRISRIHSDSCLVPGAGDRGADGEAVVLHAVLDAALDRGARGHGDGGHLHARGKDDVATHHEAERFFVARQDVVRGDRAAELVYAGILDV